MALNDLVCRHAKPCDKIYRLPDYGNLYLEIRPTGAKCWRVRYMFHGKENMLSIGLYPQVSLSEARKAREDIKAQIKNGIDPSLAKKEAKRTALYNHAQTFELVALEWHKHHYDTWKENHAKGILRRLEIHVFPFIGNYPMKQLNTRHLLDCLQRTEKTAPEIARKVLQTCKRVTQYAALTGRLDKDITFGLSGAMKRYRKGKYASIDIEEFPDLLCAINSNNGRAFRQTSIAIKLLMLTAVRTVELIHAKWPEFDFEKSLWTVPAERMKTGLVHLVPLSRQAIALLQRLKEMNGHRQFILPSLHFPRKPMSNCTILNSLKRMGYRNKMTGHGFRALFMGVSKEKLGYSHDVVDRQLAHVRRSNIDRAYDRATFIPQRTKLMQEYADYIDKISQTNQTTRINHDQSKLNDRADNPTFRYGGSLPYLQQYQPVNFVPAYQSGRNTQAEEKRTLQCVDDDGNSTVH